jgi:hypothetical protein
MDTQRLGLIVRRRLRRMSNKARLTTWDGLAALQSSKWLESSFVLWTSPNDASRRVSAVPLKPYLCRLQRKTLLEPGAGFAIADYGVLIETSVSNSYAARDPILRDTFSVPSVAKYFKARSLRRYRTDLEAIVSLGITWSSNYAHFIRDFLPKVLLLEEANVDPAIPVLVPDALFDQPFFQEAIQSKRLSRWNFMSPRGQYIQSKSLVFCSATNFHLMDRSAAPESELMRAAAAEAKFLESPEQVLALLDLEDGRPQSTAQRRLFLTRSPSRGRTLTNYEEIEPLLRERNFETVDTDGMSLGEQAQLFRECRYLIGIHGAGLANIIFAHKQELSLLELRHPGYDLGPWFAGREHLVTDYALMCQSWGFDHYEIFGTSEHNLSDAPFQIDVTELRAAIDRMLTSTRPEGQLGA